MNYKIIGRIIAEILWIEAIFMFPGLIISFYFHEYAAARAFGITELIILTVSGAFYWITRKAKRMLYAKEGFVCVGLAWLVMSILGCLPFYISREIPRYIDCLLYQNLS